jgi:uncharacterized membrane protein YGL010W
MQGAQSMASWFRPGTDLLVQFAGYHRDRRNIATHCVGIPLIVFAVGVLLARPVVLVGGLALTPAWLLWALATAWYLSRGQLVLGLLASALTALIVALAQPLGAGATAAWLAWGVGCFVVGWALQFVGHYYEGRRAAFADDPVGLLVGPMFIAAEAIFSLGWGRALLREIERGAGPTVLRDLHVPAPR